MNSFIIYQLMLSRPVVHLFSPLLQQTTGFTCSFVMTLSLSLFFRHKAMAYSLSVSSAVTAQTLVLLPSDKQEVIAFVFQIALWTVQVDFFVGFVDPRVKKSSGEGRSLVRLRSSADLSAFTILLAPLLWSPTLFSWWTQRSQYIVWQGLGHSVPRACSVLLGEVKIAFIIARKEIM